MSGAGLERVALCLIAVCVLALVLSGLLRGHV